MYVISLIPVLVLILIDLRLVEHSSRGCEEQARTLKDAGRKVKSYLDFSEPGELDERFKRLFESKLRASEGVAEPIHPNQLFEVTRDTKARLYYSRRGRERTITHGKSEVSN